MSKILSNIQQADSDELNEILLVAARRYKELTLLPLSKNAPNACIQKLESIAAFLRSHQK